MAIYLAGWLALQLLVVATAWHACLVPVDAWTPKPDAQPQPFSRPRPHCIVHIIVARHQEPVDWLLPILEAHGDWEAFVYVNAEFESVFEPNHSRIRVLKAAAVSPGQKAAEPVKYFSFIVDHYMYMSQNKGLHHDIPIKLAFVQAEPFHHNPFIFNLFRHAASWDPVYENLGLWGHPPGWGCAQAILDGVAPNIRRFGWDAMTWSDEMVTHDLQGSYFHDVWLDGLFSRMQVPASTVALDLSRVLGFELPKRMRKTYAGMFATSWVHLHSYPLEFWMRMLDFVITGLAPPFNASSVTTYDRAVMMEYSWQLILEGRAI